ncbi:MAG: beta-galactosidase [Armatimonadota bacterium]
MVPRMAITIHYMDWSKGDSEVVERLKQLKKQFCADSLKVDCSWRFVEPVEGKYDFSWPDRICRLCAQSGLTVWFILNSAWGMPDWVLQSVGKGAFAWNRIDQTGRQGVSEGSVVGKYPAPVIPAYSNPWMIPHINAWHQAVVQHAEKNYPQTIAGYIAEGEIYLNPDNDLGDGLFDYNPHTIRMYQAWLPGNTASPYYGAQSPERGANPGVAPCNSGWATHYNRWDDVKPPRSSAMGSIAWRDWAMFLRWFVAWSYQQVTRGLRIVTKRPISLLVNSFTGWPMPDDHVWGAHRTHNNAWSIYRAVVPYVDYLGVTAYQYDPDWEIDRSAQWHCDMAVMDACSHWLGKPTWIVEGGSIMRPRCLSDLRWQLQNSYIHRHPSVVIGYLDMASGQNTNYSWNPALEFPATQQLCSRYTQTVYPVTASVDLAVIYNSLSELLAPGDGTEARAVRAVVRWLRNLGVGCHVLDTQAIESGAASLKAYKLIIFPCVHPVTGVIKRLLRQSTLPIFCDKAAGSVDEWLNPSTPLRSDGVIDSSMLNREQADLEDRGIKPLASPVWLRSISTYVDTRRLDSQMCIYGRGDIGFNRDAEESVTYRSVNVAPGCEYPPLVNDQQISPMRLLSELRLNRQTDGVAGPCEVKSLPQPDGSTSVQFGAYTGPSGFWQSSVFWNIPAGSLARLRQLRFRYSVVPNAGSGSGSTAGDVTMDIRLVSSKNGRHYAVKLPVRLSPEQITIAMTAVGLGALQRRTEIDRIQLCLTANNWQPVQVYLSILQLYP